MANPLFRWLIAPIPVLLTAALLAGAFRLGMELRENAMPVSFAETLVVSSDSLPAVLGHKELGQNPGPRSAAKRHLFVDRRDDRWVIANSASDRRVFANSRDGDDYYLQRWPAEES